MIFRPKMALSTDASTKRMDNLKILELDKNATDDDIKKAYKRLALIHHPDKNPDDPGATKRFQALSQAYVDLTSALYLCEEHAGCTCNNFDSDEEDYESWLYFLHEVFIEVFGEFVHKQQNGCDSFSKEEEEEANFFEYLFKKYHEDEYELTEEELSKLHYNPEWHKPKDPRKRRRSRRKKQLRLPRDGRLQLSKSELQEEQLRRHQESVQIGKELLEQKKAQLQKMGEKQAVKQDNPGKSRPFPGTNASILKELKQQEFEKQQKEKELSETLRRQEAEEKREERANKRKEKKKQKKQVKMEILTLQQMREDEGKLPGSIFKPNSEDQQQDLNAMPVTVGKSLPVKDKSVKSSILQQRFSTPGTDQQSTGVSSELSPHRGSGGAADGCAGICEDGADWQKKAPSSDEVEQKEADVDKVEQTAADEKVNGDPALLQRHLEMYRELMKEQPQRHTEQQLKLEREKKKTTMLQKNQEELERCRGQQTQNDEKNPSTTKPNKFDDMDAFVKSRQEFLQRQRDRERKRNEEESLAILGERMYELKQKKAEPKWYEKHGAEPLKRSKPISEEKHIPEPIEQQIPVTREVWVPTPAPVVIKESIWTRRFSEQMYRNEELTKIVPQSIQDEAEMIRQAIELSRQTAQEETQRVKRRFQAPCESIWDMETPAHQEQSTSAANCHNSSYASVVRPTKLLRPFASQEQTFDGKSDVNQSVNSLNSSDPVYDKESSGQHFLPKTNRFENSHKQHFSVVSHVNEAETFESDNEEMPENQFAFSQNEKFEESEIWELDEIDIVGKPYVEKIHGRTFRVNYNTAIRLKPDPVCTAYFPVDVDASCDIVEQESEAGRQSHGNSVQDRQFSETKTATKDGMDLEYADKYSERERIDSGSVLSDKKNENIRSSGRLERLDTDGDAMNEPDKNLGKEQHGTRQRGGFGKPRGGFGKQDKDIDMEMQRAGFEKEKADSGLQKDGFGKHGQGFGRPRGGFGKQDKDMDMEIQKAGFEKQEVDIGVKKYGFGKQFPGFGKARGGFGKQDKDSDIEVHKSGFEKQEVDRGVQEDGYGTQSQDSGRLPASSKNLWGIETDNWGHGSDPLDENKNMSSCDRVPFKNNDMVNQSEANQNESDSSIQIDHDNISHRLKAGLHIADHPNDNKATEVEEAVEIDDKNGMFESTNEQNRGLPTQTKLLNSVQESFSGKSVSNDVMTNGAHTDRDTIIAPPSRQGEPINSIPMINDICRVPMKTRSSIQNMQSEADQSNRCYGQPSCNSSSVSSQASSQQTISTNTHYADIAQNGLHSVNKDTESSSTKKSVPASFEQVPAPDRSVFDSAESRAAPKFSVPHSHEAVSETDEKLKSSHDGSLPVGLPDHLRQAYLDFIKKTPESSNTSNPVTPSLGMPGLPLLNPLTSVVNPFALPGMNPMLLNPLLMQSQMMQYQMMQQNPQQALLLLQQQQLQQLLQQQTVQLEHPNPLPYVQNMQQQSLQQDVQQKLDELPKSSLQNYQISPPIQHQDSVHQMKSAPIGKVCKNDTCVEDVRTISDGNAINRAKKMDDDVVNGKRVCDNVDNNVAEFGATVPTNVRENAEKEVLMPIFKGDNSDIEIRLPKTVATTAGNNRPRRWHAMEDPAIVDVSSRTCPIDTATGINSGKSEVSQGMEGKKEYGFDFEYMNMSAPNVFPRRSHGYNTVPETKMTSGTSRKSDDHEIDMTGDNADRCTVSNLESNKRSTNDFERTGDSWGMEQEVGLSHCDVKPPVGRGRGRGRPRKQISDENETKMRNFIDRSCTTSTVHKYTIGDFERAKRNLSVSESTGEILTVKQRELEHSQIQRPIGRGRGGFGRSPKTWTDEDKAKIGKERTTSYIGVSAQRYPVTASNFESCRRPVNDVERNEETMKTKPEVEASQCKIQPPVAQRRGGFGRPPKQSTDENKTKPRIEGDSRCREQNSDRVDFDESLQNGLSCNGLFREEKRGQHIPLRLPAMERNIKIREALKALNAEHSDQLLTSAGSRLRNF